MSFRNTSKLQRTVNAHVFQQTIEKGLTALGAVKVVAQIPEYRFAAHGDRGTITAHWLDGKAVNVAVDGIHIDHVIHSSEAATVQDYALSIVRNIIYSRIDDALKNFKVEIPINLL